MGTALLAIADFWMPLQSLASRLMPARRAHGHGGHGGHGGLGHQGAIDDAAGLHYVAVRPSCAARTPAPVAAVPSRPLRVVHVVEAQPQGRPRGGNRFVISGRMDDVCAELDRLAALEAAEALSHASHAPASTRLH